MKSAYELAMERLAKEDPEGAVSLTNEQKEALTEIDQKYKAKIAEREIFLNKQLMEAQASGEMEAISQLEAQLRNERQRLEEERESAKDKIRKG